MDIFLLRPAHPVGKFKRVWNLCHAAATAAARVGELEIINIWG